MAKKPTVQIQDKGWERIKKELLELKGKDARVGVLGQKADELHKDSKTPLGLIALVNEFGSQDGTIPARPFMRTAFEKNKKAIAKQQLEAVNGIIDNKTDADKAIKAIGKTHLKNTKEGMTKYSFAPNAPSTKKEKGAGKKPLIDTGTLRNSLSFEVD